MITAEAREYIRRQVDAAPPLTAEQRDRLALLLRPESREHEPSVADTAPASAPPDKRLRRISVAAEAYSVNPRTIRRMIDSGAINSYRFPGVRVVLVDLNEIDALLTAIAPDKR